MISINLKKKGGYDLYRDALLRFGLIADVFLVNFYGKRRYRDYLEHYVSDPHTYFSGIKNLSKFVIDNILDENLTVDSIDGVIKE